MHIKRFLVFFCFLSLLLESKASFLCINNQNFMHNISIGVVIDQKSRMGKEQRTAIEVAIDDLRHCVNMSLHIRDSNGSQDRATFEAIDLVSNAHVDAILGPITRQEAAFTAKIKGNNIPIIDLSQTASIPRKSVDKLPSYIQFSTPTIYQTRCIAAIIAHYKWKEVTLIQEQGNIYSEDHSPVNDHLSNSLEEVDASVESHFNVPKLSSMPDPGAFIEEELKRVRSRNVRVFVLMHVSLEFAVVLFEKAKGLDMTEKGYVWIVSDEVANFLDSVDSSVIDNMQGVIGFKTYYNAKTDHFRDFKSKFRRKYASRYPAEEEYSNPSFYSLRAYDAIWIVSNITDANMFSNESQGLGGVIRFENGVIASQGPIFSIVNVIGKSYRDLAFWSEQSGFSNNLKDILMNNKTRMNLKNNSKNIDELSTILWPGIDQNVPRGVSLGTKENPLVIGVPANCTFKQFVHVIIDTIRNETLITGFSISVFNASLAQLAHPPVYRLEAHYGTYNEMIEKVSNKTYHGAVGDIGITAERYTRVDFSQPYLGSNLEMIVRVKHPLDSKFLALKVFHINLWITFVALGILTGATIWLNEYSAGNEDFTIPSFLHLIGSVLWFSVAILTFSQKEKIETALSRLVLTAWLSVVFVVKASFTAVLSFMLIAPSLEPSITNIDYLRNNNESVACDANSFIGQYLIDVLGFHPHQIQPASTPYDYHMKFSTGKIEAAFLQSPHAKLFLDNYCNDYIKAGSSFTLGGLGFIFEKGSHMTNDISEAILKITQSGTLRNLEGDLHASSHCSSPENGSVGEHPFSWLFGVLGGLMGIVFVMALIRLVIQDTTTTSSIHNLVQNMLLKNKICTWAFLVLTECCTRFGVSFFRQRIVRTRVGRGRGAEPNMVVELVNYQHHM